MCNAFCKQTWVHFTEKIFGRLATLKLLALLGILHHQMIQSQA